MEISRNTSLRVADAVLEAVQKELAGFDHVEGILGTFRNGREQGYSLKIESKGLEDNPELDQAVCFYFAENRSSDDVVVYLTKGYEAHSTSYPESMWETGQYFRKDPTGAAKYISGVVSEMFPNS